MAVARDSASRQLGLLAVGLVALAAGLPLLLYWLVIGRVPSVSAGEARRLLAAPGSRAVLVDARAPDEAPEGPLAGSLAWPASEIVSLRSAADVPEALAGRPLLLLSSGGVQSALAARHLAQLGPPQVYTVRGGLQSWIATAPETEGVRPTARAEQLALLVAVFPLKLLYMVLAGVAVVLTWGASALALVALRWSMLFFLAGEVFCWVNIVAFNEESLPLEFLHSWGMVVCLGFLAFTLVEGLDHGLVRYSEPRARCAFAGFCPGCAKVQPRPCLVARLFKWALPAIAASSAMLLFVQPSAVSYNTRFLGLTRNLMHPALIQLYEARFAPLAAIVLLGAAWLMLLGRTPRWRLSKVFLAAALGHLGFAVVRLTLFAYFRDALVWFVFWEEATELILVLTILFGLRVFRPEQARRAVALG